MDGTRLVIPLHKKEASEQRLLYKADTYTCIHCHAPTIRWNVLSETFDIPTPFAMNFLLLATLNFVDGPLVLPCHYALKGNRTVIGRFSGYTTGQKKEGL